MPNFISSETSFPDLAKADEGAENRADWQASGLVRANTSKHGVRCTRGRLVRSAPCDQ